jgi:hypothetical protein
MKDKSGQPTNFDQQIADEYLGKYIVVGLTFLDHEGREKRRLQMHGVVEYVTPDGIVVSLRGRHDGESWNMPPDLQAISKANPGIYTLHSTGERVENPDLLANWTVLDPTSNH